MVEQNKSYRIRTEVGKDKKLSVKLEQNYDILEIMSLKINQENAYRLHTSDYGVIAGRVLANGAFGIPNAKVSVFINIDEEDSYDVVKSVLYPYNTTRTKDANGVRYNLLPDTKVDNCHTVIGTFPEKQYALDNDSILEVFEKYYKYTTRTNNSGDYMIFGVPTGNQTIHVDIDLSDIGILSQKPRDMVYKGYNINQFENPNKFKYDTNLDSLTQVISQDSIADVIPFWGDEEQGTIGITRCDINVQYKFEPTCVFMGSVVSDTQSNGISKKCIPSPGMGAMDEITTGSGTIEMIRKKPDGSVEEFQIQGTQLINGDGVWCYQIPMNLDYMMTDEYGNMVPTNDPNKGIPTRTKVRFRISMQDFESDSANAFRCKMLVPNNPDYNTIKGDSDIDYQFGTATREDSYRDLFWNGVYSVKSYIPRIQKGSNWKNEKFTGFKRVNYYNDKNPIPYNNIRIKIPFMYTLVCAIVKMFVKLVGLLNWIITFLGPILIAETDEEGFWSFFKFKKDKKSAGYLTLDGSLCSDNLETVCIIPGINLKDKIVDRVNNGKGFGTARRKRRATLFGMALIKHAENMGIEIGGIFEENDDDDDNGTNFAKVEDTKSIDNKNKESQNKGDVSNKNKKYTIKGISFTESTDYFIQCIEMNLAQEYRVIQFDFYNDWINGMIYIPRWFRNITRKHTFLWGLIKFGGKIKACNENFSNRRGKRNLVQQCGLEYKKDGSIKTDDGCGKKLKCHKSKDVRLEEPIFGNTGLVKSTKTLKNQYVYYFKPYEYSNDSNVVKLFATDIILLGTLNSCDRWGLPNELSELRASSFQMPTNLALTDSDIEGNIYDSTEGDETVILKIKDNSKVTDIEFKGEPYRGINIMDEDGNYTELSGIEWGYEGPLQSVEEENKSNIYKPGGHFLGLTCRNSETTIKTCVNLSRICEHGVWMSQRQELNIPTGVEKDFRPYATVPNGLISQDEISGTNFRRLFATMNHNHLKTIIDPETGYPIYDFKYVNPVNFGGDLRGRIDGNYNRLVSDNVEEHYYTYDDDDYFEQKNSKTGQTLDKGEIQIMRANESLDQEYLKFRFGVDNADDRLDRYIHGSKLLNKYSFPIYENSYYFYFGLRDGNTALDEFKKQYYAVCEESNDLFSSDKKLGISDLLVVRNGACENSQSGCITFKISAGEEMFGDGGEVTVRLMDDNGVELKEEKVADATTTVSFNNLKDGIYKIIVYSADELYTNEYNATIEKVDLTGSLTSTPFSQDVTEMSESEKFSADRVQEPSIGGYIEIVGNALYYERGVESLSDKSKTISIDAYDSKYVDELVIEALDNYGNSTGKKVIGARHGNKFSFVYNGVPVLAQPKDDGIGTYMIPVPLEDTTYRVSVSIKVNLHCKMDDNGNSRKTWEIGDVYVGNGFAMDILYNDLSYEDKLKNYANGEWWLNNDLWGSLTESESWALKENLYKSDATSVHKVILTNQGGIAPYTEIVGGEEETGDEIAGVSRADFEAVIRPTLNYQISRANFTYQFEDVNGQKYPKQPFEFPVIFKPFFMEMLVCYFEQNKNFYLKGNVYNGKTWTPMLGFNDSKVNGTNIGKLVTVTEPDWKMEYNEAYNVSWDYRYNGRKSTVARQLDGSTYNL